MDDTAAVPQLRASAADATAGFLRRLFGGVDVNRAIADANALAQRVSDPVRYADVRMLLGIASTADAQPTDPLSGPGPRAIGRALNMPGAQVESYDGYATLPGAIAGSCAALMTPTLNLTYAVQPTLMFVR